MKYISGFKLVGRAAPGGANRYHGGADGCQRGAKSFIKYTNYSVESRSYIVGVPQLVSIPVTYTKVFIVDKNGQQRTLQFQDKSWAGHTVGGTDKSHLIKGAKKSK